MPQYKTCSNWCGRCKFTNSGKGAIKVASLPHWQTSPLPEPLRKHPEPQKTRKTQNFNLDHFGPLSVHIGHLTVMIDQIYIGWPILRPKTGSQAEISKILKMAILADLDNFWTFPSNSGPKMYMDSYLRLK